MSTQGNSKDYEKLDKLLKCVGTDTQLPTRGGGKAILDMIVIEDGFKGRIVDSDGNFVREMTWNENGCTIDRPLYGYDIMFD